MLVLAAVGGDVGTSLPPTELADQTARCKFFHASAAKSIHVLDEDRGWNKTCFVEGLAPSIG